MPTKQCHRQLDTALGLGRVALGDGLAGFFFSMKIAKEREGYEMCYDGLIIHKVAGTRESRAARGHACRGELACSRFVRRKAGVC